MAILHVSCLCKVLNLTFNFKENELMVIYLEDKSLLLENLLLIKLQSY